MNRESCILRARALTVFASIAGGLTLLILAIGTEEVGAHNLENRNGHPVLHVHCTPSGTITEENETVGEHVPGHLVGRNWRDVNRGGSRLETSTDIKECKARLKAQCADSSLVDWYRFEQGLGSVPIQQLAVPRKSNYHALVMSYLGVHETVQGGEFFRFLGGHDDVIAGRDVTDMALLTDRGQTVVVATEEGAVSAEITRQALVKHGELTGCSVRDLAIQVSGDGSLAVWAATDTGVRRSVDHGVNWRPSCDRPVRRVASSGTVVAALAESGEVGVLGPDGQSWTWRAPPAAN